MLLKVGTTLALELPVLDELGAEAAGLAVGDADPWSLIRVGAHIGAGSDFDPVEMVVAPVVFSNVSSPKRVSFDSLGAVGYRVVTQGEDSSEWVTPAAEVA